MFSALQQRSAGKTTELVRGVLERFNEPGAEDFDTLGDEHTKLAWQTV